MIKSYDFDGVLDHRRRALEAALAKNDRLKEKIAAIAERKTETATHVFLVLLAACVGTIINVALGENGPALYWQMTGLLVCVGIVVVLFVGAQRR